MLYFVFFMKVAAFKKEIYILKYADSGYVFFCNNS